MKSKNEFKPEVKFVTDSEKLENVILGLRRRDISDCLSPAVKHADDVLTHIALLNELAPGFFDEMLAIFIPHFMKLRHKAIIGEMAQQKADASGFGEEWREAIAAGNSPRQKDYIAKMVALFMKVKVVNQNEAIAEASRQLGREEDSIRKSVTRSKGRAKNKEAALVRACSGAGGTQKNSAP